MAVGHHKLVGIDPKRDPGTAPRERAVQAWRRGNKHRPYQSSVLTSKGVLMSTKATNISRIADAELVKALRAAKIKKRRESTGASKKSGFSLAEAVGRSARYLVTYNDRTLAAFAREDDALLFEAELADLDRARGITAARCEVLDRKGRRVGGFVITAGRMLAFVRERGSERRYTRRSSR